MLTTTVGQLLINEGLPRELRNYHRKLDKKGTQAFLDEIAKSHPEKYREISKHLADVGRDAAFTTGGNSFGLDQLEPPPAVLASRARLRRRIKDILENPKWDADLKEAKIIEATSAESDRLQKEILDETEQMGNPLATQVRSGARGKPADLKRLIGGDMLYVDHHDNVIPFPVQRGYAEGLSPAEFWAGTFGARKGLVDVKFATQDAGFLSKQLNQLGHRLIVTREDDDEPQDGLVRGLPVDVTDVDNDGALLASPVGGYPRNTTLTPKILGDLQNRGINRILVRSPVVGGPRSGGVYARDVGVRERGRMAPIGETVGLAAAQALGEPIAQGSLGSKHGGGRKGESKAVSGFDRLNQMVQVPKTFKGGAAHAQLDGRVTRMDEAPAGGQYVWVDNERHYVAPGFDLKVKPGDTVEAGDIISEGFPNPSEIVRHKGIGEGRRYFVSEFTKAFREAGMPVNRRNVEIIARGLIDHVEMVDETDDYLPNDVVGYNQLERDWRPRQGVQTLTPKQAVGKYLEKPVLHYTIGTKIRPSMLADLQQFGVGSVEVHDDEPPFQPRMIRAMAITGHDPDWMTRFLGSGQKRSLLSAVHKGSTSDTASTSFVPALMQGEEFGKTWPQNVLKPPKP